MPTHKDLEGSITISRPQGRDVNRIEIKVNDESSGAGFVSIYLDPANFAEALVGLGHVPCTFDLRSDLVGKQRQHKEEIIPYKGDSYVKPGLPRENVAGPLFAPFQVDGWKGAVDDLFNQHRRTATGYRVRFVRYVDQDEANTN